MASGSENQDYGSKDFGSERYIYGYKDPDPNEIFTELQLCELHTEPEDRLRVFSPTTSLHLFSISYDRIHSLWSKPFTRNLASAIEYF